MTREKIALVINITIVILTTVVMVQRCREDGHWSKEKAKVVFRFFTTQSNVFCAVSALCIALFPRAEWSYYLKIAGTAGVTVTMLTVLLFLGQVYGYGPLLKGQEMVVHLITPLLALISLLGFERRGVSLIGAFVGILPVALYAPLYLYKVVVKQSWDDFYAFNRGGKWPIAYALMLLGTAVICLGLYAGLNAGV